MRYVESLYKAKTWLGTYAEQAKVIKEEYIVRSDLENGGGEFWTNFEIKRPGYMFSQA